MSKFAELACEARKEVGKGAARALRREGKVPAIIYGGGGEEVNITLERRLLVREISRGGFMSRIFEVDVNGEKVRVLPREVQTHPVTDIPEHADFLRLAKGAKVNVMVPVSFSGHDQSEGLKRGGILNVVRHEVEVLCEPEKIPVELAASIAGLAIGDSLHSHSIELPEGVEFAISDRDFTVATIAGRLKEEPKDEVAGEGEEGEEEVAPGEVPSSQKGDAEGAEDAPKE